MQLAATKFKYLFDPEGCPLSNHVKLPPRTLCQSTGRMWLMLHQVLFTAPVHPSPGCWVGLQQLVTVLTSGGFLERLCNMRLCPQPKPVGWPFASIPAPGCTMGLKLVFYWSQTHLLPSPTLTCSPRSLSL